VDFNDGVELVLSSFLNPIIKIIFPNVSKSYLSLLASIFYIGILFGSFTSGHLADIYGRRKLIILGSIMQITVSFMFYMVSNLTTMLMLRFLYGYSFGFTIAITTSMFAEISP
jgi:MFS family permease